MTRVSGLALCTACAACAATMASAGCREARVPVGGAAAAGLVALPATSTCTSDSLHPATAAPAEGLWVFDSPATGRVAAMIGPAGSKAGETRLTRRVATIETGAAGRTVRHAQDAAVVRLELLPTLRGSSRPDSGVGPSDEQHPAAVYEVTPLILLASYEPCAVDTAAPRLRYIRWDGAGRVVTDVMLARASGGS